ncbi:MAG: class I tRNA ligase family protein, partial [Flavobacteriaceae bacterium]|nr:class I tRNA ligase family protein [Flavobacteriaceae bacterium]
KEIGDRHNLEIIDVLNSDGTMNSFGLHHQGKDRVEARKDIALELENMGLLAKTESITHSVGTSERTKAVIEPRLSDQWFLKMQDLAKPALDNVMNDTIHFFPKKFKNSYRNWMENVRDWNISRQLYWGHQIPAYFYGDGKNDFVVAETREEALQLAQKINPKILMSDLIQEEDVVDTWFSSWLWPISVFDGIRKPNNEEINYYYPTNDLVTAPEIMFFWVARMIIAGYEYRGEQPFKNVYYTGIVRDKQGRKMSKSLGNSPDPIELMEKYGADGVRIGMLMCSPAGNDLPFDEALCQQGKQFANKIWNTFRLVNSWEIGEIDQPKSAEIALSWYKAKFNSTLTEIEDHFSKYRLSDALMAVYKLIWDDFASWLLEIVKPAYEQPIDAKTYHEIIEIFENNLKILHPFMPFLTEEIWQYIAERTPHEALMVADYPVIQGIDESLISEFDFMTEVISGIRTIRKEKNIAFKNTIDLSILNNENVSKRFDVIIKKLGNIDSLQYTANKIEGAMSFRVKSNEYFIPISSDTINIDQEIKKLTEELNYTEGFLKSVQKKLTNERFVNNAPEQVIANEKKKEADAMAKIETIKASIAGLS